MTATIPDALELVMPATTGHEPPRSGMNLANRRRSSFRWPPLRLVHGCSTSAPKPCPPDRGASGDAHHTRRRTRSMRHDEARWTTEPSAGRWSEGCGGRSVIDDHGAEERTYVGRPSNEIAYEADPEPDRHEPQERGDDGLVHA